jgi:hypothetical protein
MGALALPLQIASAAVSAIGSIRAAQAQSASYQAQAQAMEYNATVAKNNAVAANQQASAAEEQQRRKFAMLQGQAAAGAAQSGAGLEGSNADILEQNALMNELDALTIRYEGQNRAKTLEAQAQLDEYQAVAASRNADTAMQAGYWNAGANLLSGATSYSMYSKGLYGAGGQGGFMGIKIPGGR